MQPTAPDPHGHVPVLPKQVLELLSPQPGQVALDCTLGRGGHSELLAERLAPGGRLIALDLDPANLEHARQRLEDAPVPVDLVHANFAGAKQVLADRGIEGVDLLLADLGFASVQMDDPQRGFSFDQDGPLDMRLDPTQAVTAADLVNELPADELANLIYQLGEERLSRRIARKIAERREDQPIQTTRELAQLVEHAYRGGRQSRGRGRTFHRIHPATRTFMALRIAVNQELEALDRLLEELPGLLKVGGVAALISFHSLEDRRVKHAFLDLARQERGQVLTRKPVTAEDQESRANPRSRSAKLRAIRIIA